MRPLLRSTLILFAFLFSYSFQAQNSVAHVWMETNLEAVRKDLARPTVHARNLWNISMAMYDAWAAYDTLATPYFLGKGMGAVDCPFEGVPTPTDLQEAREEAISFAAYRMLRHRYTGSPGQVNTFFILDTTMTHLGYDESYTSTDYTTGVPAALGNYIAENLIAACLQDGANEANGYANEYYEPVNDALPIDEAHYIGNTTIDSLNRWQPLSLTLFCDQGGNSFTTTPGFLSPEWGNVIPFALADSVKTIKTRDGYEWNLFHDPGVPPRMGMEGDGDTEFYRWGFDLVAKWSSHLDPNDPTMIDISPASIGNIPFELLPDHFTEYDQFYDRDNGGDASLGHTMNPHTGMPYAPQIVPRGDYGRILAEFWADGPDSETPPGHWFAIYNEISQYPDFTWKWNGQDSLDHLEYDIKTYFTLGGGMHDAAISAWAVKGYYDYIRPVSAIRAMAELGQSSDENLPNYHPAGLQLEPGFMELVQLGDTIWDSDTIMVAGPDYVGEIKMMCWLGPLTEDTCISGFAPDYQTELAGVGWKLAKDWWPYQRPTFVTPPFAGYVSGHSTYSRAAAEIMTITTGDRFFPGGMGIFDCPQNEYLVFEEGPSMDIELQWATYQDASDQCSLSRIWGGIHPPADDIPGRKIGYEVGHNASTLAQRYFTGGYPKVESITISDDIITDADAGSTLTVQIAFDQRMDESQIPTLGFSEDLSATLTAMTSTWTDDQTLEISYTIADADEQVDYTTLSISGARNFYGNDQVNVSLDSALFIDTDNPVADLEIDLDDPAFVIMNVNFNQEMETSSNPVISFPVEDPITDGVITYNGTFSAWISDTHFAAVYDVNSGVQLYDIDVNIASATDTLGNAMVMVAEVDTFSVDTKAPTPSLAAGTALLTDAEVGAGALEFTVTFDEDMDTSVDPVLNFTSGDPLASSLTEDAGASSWTSSTTYVYIFDLTDAGEELMDIDVEVSQAIDLMGNFQTVVEVNDPFLIDTRNPLTSDLSVSISSISDLSAGTDMLVIEAVFDEAMDTGMNATLDFPTEDPGSTLTLSSSSWSDDFTHTWTFDVVDNGLDLADIDLEISAAADANGNSMQALTVADQLDIDMENPQGSLLIASPSPITDQSLTSWYISFQFSEEMDTDVTPSVVFPSEITDNTLTLVGDSWPDEFTYELEFSVTDADEEFFDVSFSVAEAADTAGNILQPFSTSDLLDIEMSNPALEEAVTNTTVVDNSFIGVNTFFVDVEFDEALDQSTDLSVSFPVEDPSTSLSLNTDESAWTSESSYRFAFDVLEGLSALQDIDVEITGVSDLFGNPGQTAISVDLFDIDIASGITEYAELGLQIFPNPITVGEDLQIGFERSLDGQWNLELIDGLGRTVKAETIQVIADGRISWSTNSIAPGQYVLRLTGQEGVMAVQIHLVR